MAGVNINKITGEESALEAIAEAAKYKGFDLKGSRLIRTSSRACLSVEHGDYNGTGLFGFATDKYIWAAYKTRQDDKIRLYSANFPEEGIVQFSISENLDPSKFKDKWARFPVAAVYVLKQHGYNINKGIDGMILGNIPGGGMSRSASLTINLLHSLMLSNGYEISDPMEIVEMAVKVEHSFGSKCGNLDQIMIMFGKEGKGTYYNPQTGEIEYIKFGGDTGSWRFVVLDTGTERPGLDKARYVIRKAECEELVKAINDTGDYGSFSNLAEIKDGEVFQKIMADGRFNIEHRKRLEYIFNAQGRFSRMLDAWKSGDIKTVGDLFNQDGIELDSLYDISGPELEAMCRIARNVTGVFGARMLGGGDKGAAGALVDPEAVDALADRVGIEFPGIYTGLREKYAVHAVKLTQGVKLFYPGEMDRYFRN